MAETATEAVSGPALSGPSARPSAILPPRSSSGSSRRFPRCCRGPRNSNLLQVKAKALPRPAYREARIHRRRRSAVVGHGRAQKA